VVIRNVSIPIINDKLVEPLEKFSLSIQIQPEFSNLGVVQGTPATAIGFIIDDDGMYMYTLFIYVHRHRSITSYLSL